MSFDARLTSTIALIRGSELLGATALALLVKVGVAVVVLGFNLLIARLLGANDAGLFFLALSILTIAVVIGRGGFDNPLIRFTAADASRGQFATVSASARFAVVASAGLSLGVTVVLWVSAPGMANGLFDKPELVEPLRYLSASVLPMSLMLLFSQLLKGLSRIVEHLVIFSGLLPGIAGVMAYVFAPSHGLAGVCISWSAAAFLSCFIAAVLWFRQTRGWTGVPQSGAFQRLLASARPEFWTSLAIVLIQWSSPLMLGVWGTNAEVAMLTLASRVAVVTNLVLVAVSSVVTPRFARLHIEGDIGALQSTARNSAMLTAIVAFPIAGILIVAPGWVMSIFGTEFRDGSTALAMIAIGQFINVATGSVGALLVMTGHETIVRNLTLFSAALVLFLNTLMIPIFGINGAAAAMMIVLAGQNLAATWIVRKRLGIWSIPGFELIRHKN